MEIFKNLFVLIVVLFSGWIYYRYSISKTERFREYAFIMKIFFLAVSFMLAFFKCDYIIMGDFTFGGRPSILILIIIEIVDAFIDKKKDRADA